MRSIPVLAVLFAAAALARPAAAETLKLEVITAPADDFLVNATLISGTKDAVLIDGGLTFSDAHRIAARVLESKRTLTTIYVTHSHPDHYFGLNVLKQAFPKAKIVALPATIAGIKKSWKGKVAQWGPMFGANLSTKPVIPTPLKGTSIMLEGEQLEIVGGLQGDDAANSYVWVPSLRAVVAGDIVYDGVHVWTAETTAEARKAWAATLDQIAARKPAIVVPGHQVAEAKQDPKNVEWTRAYLKAFDEAVAASKTPDEVVAKLKAKYPKAALEIIATIGAGAQFPAAAPATPPVKPAK